MHPRYFIAKAAAVAAALLTLTATLPAQAQDAYCSGLRNRLASIQRGASGGDVDQLYRRLSDARAEARYEGCGGGFFSGLFDRGRSPYCGRILADIRSLERQLDNARYNRWSRGGRGSEREAAALRQEMREAGCSSSSRQRSASWGPYRTLCVREEDGYFFPISTVARKGDLKTHAAACQAVCPGHPVALYYQPVDEEDVSTAVSLDGEPYAELPTAFRFRQTFDDRFSCAPKGGWASVAALYPTAGQTAAGKPAWAAGIVPVPVSKPARAEDPETLANRAGDFAARRGEPIVAAEVDAPPIRMVGPAFYYAR